MFRNQMPRYDILSEDAMATLDTGWRRLITEIGVEFMDSAGARPLPPRTARRSRTTPSSSTPTSCSSRSPRRRASSTSRPATPRTPSTSAATRWPSARSTGRRSSARGRYAATRRFDDFQQFTKLAQSFPVLDSAGGVICEPNDTPLDSRHLDMTCALQTLTDKVYMGNVVSGVNAADTIAMGEILFGSREAIEETPVYDLADQLQLAAALGRPDARGAVRVLRAPTSRSCSRRSS